VRAGSVSLGVPERKQGRLAPSSWCGQEAFPLECLSESKAGLSESHQAGELDGLDDRKALKKAGELDELDDRKALKTTLARLGRDCS